jgi:hypothetical protein
VFDNPKSYIDMERLITYLTEPGDLILDYFAGSGTTAHGVLLANRSNGTARHFITVQLPEPVAADSEVGRNAISIGCHSVADICKERLRRVINELNADDSIKLPLDGPTKEDRGFWERVRQGHEPRLLLPDRQSTHRYWYKKRSRRRVMKSKAKRF